MDDLPLIVGILASVSLTMLSVT